MRSSRTSLAIGVLFAGVLGLLLWRYDPWVYGGAISHPFVTLFVVVGAVIFLVLTLGYTVNDPKRAVLFKEGRFDRVEPGGRMLLWPGTEVGTEISLVGQRVLGWPILAYDQKGSEVSVIFGLTWRIVPSSTKPSAREQRMLLSTNEQRRLLVIQALESVIREIARCTTVDYLKGVLTNGNCIEAIRQVVTAQIEEDALTLDHLHLVRFIPSEKKDEAVPIRETRTVEETRTWGGPALEFDPSAHSATNRPINQIINQLSGGATGGGATGGGATGGGATGGGATGGSSRPGEVEPTEPPRSGWFHRGHTETITRGERLNPEKKPDPNICCADCGLPVDPKAPAFTVRFCRQCGGSVTPCLSCGRQQGPCPSCGCPAA
jgi:uncharacterized membrane protein YgcG